MIELELYQYRGANAGRILAFVNLPCVPREGDEIFAGNPMEPTQFVVTEGPASFFDGVGRVGLGVRHVVGSPPPPDGLPLEPRPLEVRPLEVQ